MTETARCCFTLGSTGCITFRLSHAHMEDFAVCEVKPRPSVRLLKFPHAFINGLRQWITWSWQTLTFSIVTAAADKTVTVLWLQCFGMPSSTAAILKLFVLSFYCLGIHICQWTLFMQVSNTLSGNVLFGQPSEWPTLIRSARTDPEPYTVITMVNERFLNWG